MIGIVAKLKVKPGSEAAFEAAFQELAAAVRAVEARLPEAFRFADPLEMRADSPLPRR